ncbi:MAG: hypothetical protein WD035_04310 [Balneolaceae bacterium]
MHKHNYQPFQTVSSCQREAINRRFKLLLFLFIPFFILSCDTLDSHDSAASSVFQYDFNESDHGWEAFFSDYNVDWGEKMKLHADYRALPEPLDTTTSAHYIRAVNHSGDVKMLFRRQVDGLEPNTSYQTSYTVRFATSAPSNCVGVGGPPGEAVKVIAAASDLKPEAVIEEEPNEYYRLNLQQQNDSPEWYPNAILGDIANSRDCEEGPEFEIKELVSDAAHGTVTTDIDGRAWLLFGTRSGFEGRTDLYFTYFRAEFEKIDS